jgi:hypothetical protein
LGIGAAVGGGGGGGHGAAMVPDDYYEVYVKYLTCMELYSKVVSDRGGEDCAGALKRSTHGLRHKVQLCPWTVSQVVMVSMAR